VKVKKNKKGSHVGMVLSFTMFIIFLIFVYVIVGSPVNSKKQNENIFETIQKETIKAISDLVYTTRIYDAVNVGGCIEISNPETDFTNLVVIVKNESGEISSDIIGDSTYLPGGIGFMKAYYSDDLFEKEKTFSESGCISILTDSITNEKRILEKKIINLLTEMDDNYSIVKNNFGIDNSVNFNLQFNYENGTVLESSEFKELKTEIFAKEISINYLDIYANEKIGSLIIKTW
jgi:hypothetical protein